MVGAILPGRFIQHFRFLTVLQVAVVLICSILISSPIVHHQLLSVHLRSRVIMVVSQAIKVSFRVSSLSIQSRVIHVVIRGTLLGFALEP